MSQQKRLQSTLGGLEILDDVAMLSSWIIALTAIPMLCVVFLKVKVVPLKRGLLKAKVLQNLVLRLSYKVLVLKKVLVLGALQLLSI